MKIAVCIYVTNNSGKISTSFRKSQYFFIYDADKESIVEKVTNHLGSSPGAEIFCAQLLIKKGVNIVVCGRIEDDAKRLFEEADVKLIENIDGNAGLFINDYYKEFRAKKKLTQVV